MFDSGPSVGGGGFGFMFTLVPILMVIVFAIVIVGIFTNGVRYFRNSSSPKQSVYARVAAKRMELSTHTHHHNNGNGGVHPVNSSRTHYYITLEFENGERREYLDVKNLYGLLVEGDEGYAAVQGEWIVAFERSTN